MNTEDETRQAPVMIEHASLEAELARQTQQGKTLREAKEKLGVTSEELAELLGVALPTLHNWLLPAHSARHREMPKTAKLLLAYILKDRRKGKGR